MSIKRKLMSVSAPGKIIISGEHSVVYQKNAICGAINLKCKCEAWEEQLVIQEQSRVPKIVFVLQDLKQTINIPLHQIEITKQLVDYIEFMKERQSILDKRAQLFKYKILACLKVIVESEPERQEQIDSFIKSNKQYTLIVNSEIPIGGGLGSSAAFSTCIAASLISIISNINKPSSTYIPNKPLINKLSFEYEKIYHTKPSGLDNSISLNGGLLIFNKTSGASPVDWKMNLKFGVVDSKVEKNTGKAVLQVASKYQKQGKLLIDQIGTLTDNLIERIKDCDQKSFLQGLNTNHGLLKQLDLSNKEIEGIVQKYQNQGMAAKITGAGMGGYVLIVSRQDLAIEGVNWRTISKEGLQIQMNNQL